MTVKKLLFLFALFELFSKSFNKLRIREYKNGNIDCSLLFVFSRNADMELAPNSLIAPNVTWRAKITYFDSPAYKLTPARKKVYTILISTNIARWCLFKFFSFTRVK